MARKASSNPVGSNPPYFVKWESSDDPTLINDDRCRVRVKLKAAA